MDNTASISVRLPIAVKQRLAREAWERRESFSVFLRDQLTALVADDPDEWRNPPVQVWCITCKESGAAFNWMVDFAATAAGKVTPILRFQCPAGHNASQILTATPSIQPAPGPMRSNDKLLLSLSQALYAARTASNSALDSRDDVIRRLRRTDDYALPISTISRISGLSRASVYNICHGLKPPPRPRAAPRRRRRRKTGRRRRR